MAQLISREQILQLVKADGKVEESENTFSYKDFCKVHTEYIEDGKHLDRLNDLDDGEDAYMHAYSEVKSKYLKKMCPPIKYAGSGSSRAAFALAGGKCLKVAINTNGIRQNKQELKNTANNSLQCFTKIYGHSKDIASLLTECCAKATEDDFVNLFSYDIEQVICAICLIVYMHGISNAMKQLDIKSALSALRKMCKKYDIVIYKQYVDKVFAESIMQLISDISSIKSPQYNVMRDLIKFYQSKHWHIDELLPIDLLNEDNWGIVSRNRKLCLVILDSGFSKDIVDNFYY